MGDQGYLKSLEEQKRKPDQPQAGEGEGGTKGKEAVNVFMCDSI